MPAHGSHWAALLNQTFSGLVSGFASAGAAGGGARGGDDADPGEAESPDVVGDAAAVPASGFVGAEGSEGCGASGVADFVAAGGLGLGGGLGFSGLMPPSQCGPEYTSGARSPAFHLASKSAAALLTVSPMPTNRFQGYMVGETRTAPSACREYRAIGLPR